MWWHILLKLMSWIGLCGQLVVRSQPCSGGQVASLWPRPWVLPLCTSKSVREALVGAHLQRTDTKDTDRAKLTDGQTDRQTGPHARLLTRPASRRQNISPKKKKKKKKSVITEPIADRTCCTRTRSSPLPFPCLTLSGPHKRAPARRGRPLEKWCRADTKNEPLPASDKGGRHDRILPGLECML